MTVVWSWRVAADDAGMNNQVMPNAGSMPSRIGKPSAAVTLPDLQVRILAYVAENSYASATKIKAGIRAGNDVVEARKELVKRGLLHVRKPGGSRVEMHWLSNKGRAALDESPKPLPQPARRRRVKAADAHAVREVAERTERPAVAAPEPVAEPLMVTAGAARTPSLFDDHASAAALADDLPPTPVGNQDEGAANDGWERVRVLTVTPEGVLFMERSDGSVWKAGQVS